MDSRLQDACSQPKSLFFELESTPYPIPDSTRDGTKHCCLNTPASQGDMLHMIEQAAQSGSPKEMLQCFNQLIHDESKVNQESLDQGLLLSCRYGREFLVKILIFHGAHIETRDEDGNTPLLICAEKGFTDIALLLVDKGADINSYNKDGDTALLLSIQTSGSSHLIEKLLNKKDLNISHRNKYEYDALMKSIEVLNFPLLNTLLDRQLHPLSYKKSSNNSFKSEHHGVAKIAENLGLKSFISILNQYSVNFKSVLRAAVSTKDFYILKLILYCQFVDFSSTCRNNDDAIVPIFLSSLQESKIELSVQDLSIIKLLLKGGAPLHSFRTFNESPLVTAVKLGCYALVEMFCQHKHSGRDIKDNNIYALVLAAEMGRCDILKLLIEYGKVDHYMRPALQSSLTKEHIDCAKLLIKHGAKIIAEEVLEDTVRNNRVKTFLFLEEYYKFDISSEIKIKGPYFLNIALREGHKEIIKLLVEEGADLNAMYNYKTPLMSADDPSVMEFLIEIGADVNAMVDKCGITYSILDFVLTENKVGKSRLDLLQRVKLLLHHGANVNVQNILGNTPLMTTSQKLDMEYVLRALIQAGADVNQQNNKGESALHFAASSDLINNAKILLEFKSEVDLKNKDGRTPLFYCLLRGSLQMIQLLIKNNANVNCEDNNGDTPLLYLCSSHASDQVEVVEMLIKAGVSVNHHNSEGYTPLMIAANEQSHGVLQVLCESGAEINSVNEKINETALSILLNMYYDKNDVLYLIEKGADCSCLSPFIINKFICMKRFSCFKQIIALGLGPEEINPELLFFDENIYPSQSVSPFVLCLCKGRMLEEKDHSEYSEFLDTYLSQPMSLQKLSFVVVSSAVGADAGRKERVGKLPIPKMLQDKLLFKDAEKVEADLQADVTVDEISFIRRLLITD